MIVQFVLNNAMINIYFVANVDVSVVLAVFQNVRAKNVRYVDAVNLLPLDLLYNYIIFII